MKECDARVHKCTKYVTKDCCGLIFEEVFFIICAASNSLDKFLMKIINLKSLSKMKLLQIKLLKVNKNNLTVCRVTMLVRAGILQEKKWVKKPLHEQVQNLHEMVQHLTATSKYVPKLQATILDQSERILQLEETVVQLQKTQPETDQSQRLKQLEVTVTQLQKTLRETNCQDHYHSDAVGFSAFHVESPNPDQLAGSTIPFQEVEFQNGLGYDSVTGVFTCPTAGNYFFSVTICSDDGSSSTSGAYVDLIRNDESVGYIRLYNIQDRNSTGATVSDMGSINVITTCLAEREVKVVARATSRVLSNIDGRTSSFTGFLLNSIS